MEGTACRSDDPSTPPNAMAHPAWQLLTEPGAAKLAWRRAACQNPDVCAVSETSRGGLLQILQEAGLAVPPKTKGAVNAYVTASLTDELGQAMQSYLGSTTEPFYRSSPRGHTNYGGKGAGQQRWWSATKGWRVTQPNRHMMAHLAGASASASASDRPLQYVSSQCKMPSRVHPWSRTIATSALTCNESGGHSRAKFGYKFGFESTEAVDR